MVLLRFKMLVLGELLSIIRVALLVTFVDDLFKMFPILDGSGLWLNNDFDWFYILNSLFFYLNLASLSYFWIKICCLSTSFAFDSSFLDVKIGGGGFLRSLAGFGLHFGGSPIFSPLYICSGLLLAILSFNKTDHLGLIYFAGVGEVLRVEGIADSSWFILTSV